MSHPAKIVCADVLKWCAEYDGPKFHAALMDPPYHLTSITKRFGKDGAAPAKRGTDGAFTRAGAGFMGKTWDGGSISFQPETWAALSEHLHPGAFIMAFGGSRTYHRLACAIEDADFIIHPAISWVFGSGFPKATNLSKAIDREAGEEQVVIGDKVYADGTIGHFTDANVYGAVKNGTTKKETAPSTDLAKTWSGHRYGGQALKPAAEFICVAQKPYDGRAIDSITTTGAGALNIDSGRIAGSNGEGHWSGDDGSDQTSRPGYDGGFNAGGAKADGRWPSNLVIDRECAELLDAQSGVLSSEKRTEVVARRGKGTNGIYGDFGQIPKNTPSHPGQGGASRFFFNVDRSLEDADPFFYCAKAGREERNSGLDHLPKKPLNRSSGEQSPGTFQAEGVDRSARNPHPCVKPISLCKYLSGLLLPPDAYAPRRILVPFAGSGSEAIAAMLAGWEDVIGIEAAQEYVDIAEARIAWWHSNHFGMFAEVGFNRNAKAEPQHSLDLE